MSFRMSISETLIHLHCMSKIPHLIIYKSDQCKFFFLLYYLVEFFCASKCS